MKQISYELSVCEKLKCSLYEVMIQLHKVVIIVLSNILVRCLQKISNTHTYFLADFLRIRKSATNINWLVFHTEKSRQKAWTATG